jgi:nitrogen fixation/metabolism regulation signal transduction histidine kinase
MAPPLPRAPRRASQFTSRLIRYGLIGGLALAGVLLFVLTSASGNSRAFERNYPILLAANGAIALVLFVLVAALALRLVRRVRAKRFGARLMARFALAFALMGVLPGVLVYVVSSQFLLRSIESWFNVEVEGALESGLALGRAVLESQRDDLKLKARAMAQELADAPSLEHPRILERLRERVGVEQATIVSASGNLVWSSSAPGFDLAPVMPTPTILRTTLSVGGYALIEGDELAVEPGHGLRTRAIVPIPFSSSARSFGSMSLADALPRSGTALRLPGAGRIRIEEPRFLQLTQSVAPAVAANAQALQTGYGEYQQLSLARSGLQSIYRLTLTLTLLLAVFAAIASGVLLAGSMTAPLVELAAGTKAVAEGDFRPVREFRGNDELNLLPQSFNAMTRQLAEARDAVETRSRQLETARAYLERLLANLSAGVIVLDRNFAIVTANYGAGRILGVPLATRGGHNLQAEVPQLAEQLSSAFRDQALVAAPKDSWQQQMQLTRAGAAAGAEPLALLVRGSRLPLEDGLGYVVVFDDITQVISAQRAVAWGEVARRLAHEIKNPLTPIQLAAERLRMKLGPALGGAQLDVLERGISTIVNQVAAMKRMVDEFRDYARLPAARLAPLDLNVLVEEIGALYGVEPGAGAGIPDSAHGPGAPAAVSPAGGAEPATRVELRLAPGLPLLAADAGQIRQVIHNLVGNAIESIAGAPAAPAGRPPRRGLVTVRTEIVAIDHPGRGAAAAARAVRLSVEDNGPGFPANILRRAFEPYITTKPRGTGLGLALVKKIIDEHDGRIEIVNREGASGATVTIVLHRLAVSPSPAGAAV